MAGVAGGCKRCSGLSPAADLSRLSDWGFALWAYGRLSPGTMLMVNGDANDFEIGLHERDTLFLALRFENCLQSAEGIHIGGDSLLTAGLQVVEWESTRRGPRRSGVRFSLWYIRRKCPAALPGATDGTEPLHTFAAIFGCCYSSAPCAHIARSIWKVQGPSSQHGRRGRHGGVVC